MRVIYRLLSSLDAVKLKLKMNQNNNNPFIHVPKYDKTTGQPIPQWKQQIIFSKMTKRMEEEAQIEKVTRHKIRQCVWRFGLREQN